MTAKAFLFPHDVEEIICKERRRLTATVVRAGEARYKAELERDRARIEKRDVNACAETVVKARVAERVAVAALERHRKQHGC